MADALLSPFVGGTMLAVTAGLAAFSVKKVQKDLDDTKIPLMGVMGAFVFAAQMINFTIPATGSSGHLGGGLLLAILLGPDAGFLTMASVLLIQALFFGDGGLLALGSNVFNLGFFTCFIAYPYIYKWIIRKGLSGKRIFSASLLAAVAGLQLGAFSVVLETFFSGKTELPLATFVLLMQPIHLAIGIGEGLVTAAVVTFVWKAQPEILERTAAGQILGQRSLKKVLTALLIAVVIVGGALSWFASTNPDGLEWAMAKTAGTSVLESDSGIHRMLAWIQESTAILPDYGFKHSSDNAQAVPAGQMAPAGAESGSWPAVSAGTSLSGLVGGMLTLVLAAGIGLIAWLVKRRRKGMPCEMPLDHANRR